MNNVVCMNKLEDIEFVIASHNEAKSNEIIEILGRCGIRAVKVPDDITIPEETGTTYAENALIKARAVCEATGKPVIADDSGLEVDALNGAPGLYSARYGTPEYFEWVKGNCSTNLGHIPDSSPKTDIDRCGWLLSDVTSAIDPNRNATYRCAIACIFPNGDEITTSGCLSGSIGTELRGTNGFGYDRIFIPIGEKSTMACLPADKKNIISHRANALNKMVVELSNYVMQKYVDVPKVMFIGIDRFDVIELIIDKFKSNTHVRVKDITAPSDSDIDAVVQYMMTCRDAACNEYKIWRLPKIHIFMFVVYDGLMEALDAANFEYYRIQYGKTLDEPVVENIINIGVSDKLTREEYADSLYDKIVKIISPYLSADQNDGNTWGIGGITKDAAYRLSDRIYKSVKRDIKNNPYAYKYYINSYGKYCVQSICSTSIVGLKYDIFSKANIGESNIKNSACRNIHTVDLNIDAAKAIAEILKEQLRNHGGDAIDAFGIYADKYEEFIRVVNHEIID